MDRAKRGGEIGINGEEYQGGQFLPSSKTTIKGMQNGSSGKAKPRKQEVAPYLWQVSDKQAIWPKINLLVQWDGPTSYSKETGKTGQVRIAADLVTMGWSKEGIKSFQELVNRWNNGERWI